jgi:deoxycytidylate deaminase
MERITNSQESKTFVVPQFIFEAACEAGKKSPCRSQRGVVLWDGFGIVSVGYNHLQLAACDHSDACKAVCGKLALHAEEHAIATATRPTASASMFPVKIVDAQPVASGAPSCIRCSNQILAHGMAIPR